MTRGVGSSGIAASSAGLVTGGVGVRRAISLPSAESSGMHAMVTATRISGKRAASGADQVLRARQAKDDEAELAARAEQQPGLQAGQPAQTEAARKCGDDRRA